MTERRIRTRTGRSLAPELEGDYDAVAALMQAEEAQAEFLEQGFTDGVREQDERDGDRYGRGPSDGGPTDPYWAGGM